MVTVRGCSCESLKDFETEKNDTIKMRVGDHDN